VKSAILGIAAVFSVASSGTALAKKPPVPAPNISASVAIKADVQAEQLPPSVPIYDESVSLSLSHSFEITQQQESALQADTLISILGIEFQPSDDPNYSNGDTSIKVEAAASLGLGVTEELPVTISAKWGKGKFTISVKGKLKVTDVTAPAPVEAIVAKFIGAESVQSATMTPRQDVMVQTAIKHPSIPDLLVEANLACDVEQVITQGSTAEGVIIMGQTVDAKSKFFAPAP